MEVKGSVAAQVGGIGSVLAGAPHFAEADVSAACRHSVAARRVRKSFDEAVDTGRVFSRMEIRDLLDRAAPKGKPDAKAGVVVAYYAENHQKIFSKEALREVKGFLKDIDWATVVHELNDLKAKLAEEEKAAELERQKKKQILDDDNKVDDRKRGLVKQNGTAAERAAEVKKTGAKKQQEKAEIRAKSEFDLDEELTSSGRVPLSEVQVTTLKLHKKAYSTRES